MQEFQKTIDQQTDRHHGKDGHMKCHGRDGNYRSVGSATNQEASFGKRKKTLVFHQHITLVEEEVRRVEGIEEDLDRIRCRKRRPEVDLSCSRYGGQIFCKHMEDFDAFCSETSNIDDQRRLRMRERYWRRLLGSEARQCRGGFHSSTRVTTVTNRRSQALIPYIIKRLKEVT